MKTWLGSAGSKFARIVMEVGGRATPLAVTPKSLSSCKDTNTVGVNVIEHDGSPFGSFAESTSHTVPPNLSPEVAARTVLSAVTSKYLTVFPSPKLAYVLGTETTTLPWASKLNVKR